MIIKNENTLYLTCKLIGDHIDLYFEPFQTSPILPMISQIFQLCLKSNIYFSEVSLSKEWWKNDQGPLLGFYGKDKIPVALLPINQKSYQMVNVQENKAELVTEHTSLNLCPVAIKFYRKFINNDEITSKSLLSFLFSKKRYRIVRMGILGLLAMSLNLTYPFLVKFIFASILPFTTSSMLLPLGLSFIFITFANTMFTIIRQWIAFSVQDAGEKDLAGAAWQKVLQLRLHLFRDVHFREAAANSLTLHGIRERMPGSTVFLMFNACFSVLILIPMTYFSPLLTLLSVFIFSFQILLIYLISKSVLHFSDKLANAYLTTNDLVLQFIGGLSRIRIAAKEYLFFNILKNKIENLKSIYLKRERKLNLTLAFNSICFRYSWLVLLTITLLIPNYFFHLSMGNMVAFLSAYAPFMLAAEEISRLLDELLMALATWRKNLSIYNKPVQELRNKETLDFFKGEIRVENVSFHYSNPTRPFALQGISFHAAPGESIGLLGCSSSGKSTLAKLIMGLEKPNKGAIYYDRYIHEDIAMKDLHEQVGNILEFSQILDGTIRSNIMTKAYHTEDDLHHVLDIVELSEEMSGFPMGLETVLNVGGKTLSEGQKQRILLARALMGHPKMLVLDMPLAVLDVHTQSRILRKVIQAKPITIIVFTNRIHALKDFARIYCIDEGKIIKTANYHELIKEESILAKFS